MKLGIGKTELMGCKYAYSYNTVKEDALYLFPEEVERDAGLDDSVDALYRYLQWNKTVVKGNHEND